MLLFLAFVLLATLGTIYGDSSPMLSQPIDIGFGLDENSLPFPGYAPFRYTKRATGHWGGENGPWYAYNEFASSEHVGTIMMSPGVIHVRATPIGNTPINKLMTKAILVDISEEVGDNWNYTLPVEKLEEWVATNGPIPYNSVLLFKFGWSSRYPNKDLYWGPSDTDFRWPGLSEKAFEWIVNSGKIVVVGSDTTALAPGTTVFGRGVDDLILVENNIYELLMLNLQADLPPTFNIMVMPMKFTEGPASPTRVIAY